MPDLTVSVDVDAFLAAANDAAARGELALTSLALVTPGTGVNTALALNVGSAGAFLTLNGAGGTPSSMVGTNITGTAAGLTAGVASAAPVAGLTGAGTGILTALAVNANAGGGLIVLADPGADRIPFWDDSAGAFVFLTVGSGLDLTTTTLTATANANAVTLASAAAGAGLMIVSAGADRTATATDTVTTINASNVKILDAVDQSHGLSFVVSSNLAADKTFTYTGAFNFTMTLTADTGVTFPTTGTLSTLAGVETLTNKSIPVTVKVTAASYTVGTTSALELYGGVIFVTGAATITIPAVVAGQSFTVITEGAVAVSVDPNAADLIVLDGTALSDGDKITNLSTAGDMAVFVARDATGWSAQTNGWTDTN
jgi:hypothetical protein